MLVQADQKVVANRAKIPRGINGRLANIPRKIVQEKKSTSQGQCP